MIRSILTSVQCSHENRECFTFVKVEKHYVQQNNSWQNSEIPTDTTGATRKKWSILCHSFYIFQWCLPYIWKNCQKSIMIDICMSSEIMCLHIFSKHRYSGPKCALLVYSHSLLMKIARYNGSPIRFWLALEKLSWPTRRRTYLILPNIWQLSNGAHN